MKGVDMKTSAFEVGDEIAFNMLPDATWFEIVTLCKFDLTVREVGKNYKIQYFDRCMVKQVRKPSK